VCEQLHWSFGFGIFITTLAGLESLILQQARSLSGQNVPDIDNYLTIAPA